MNLESLQFFLRGIPSWEPVPQSEDKLFLPSGWVVRHGCEGMWSGFCLCGRECSQRESHRQTYLVLEAGGCEPGQECCYPVNIFLSTSS